MVSVKRGRIIIRVLGLTSRKMAANLRKYCRILDKYRTTATFPVPAVVLEKHFNVLAGFKDRVEFAVHGYSHKDYSLLTRRDCEEEFRKAKSIFSRLGLPAAGFRAPYLKWNGNTLRAAARHYEYDSSQSLLWHDEQLDNVRDWILSFYNPKDASQCQSLPVFFGDAIHLSVSLPDDEILGDRLSMSRVKATQFWLRILEQTYRRGEMFVLQLHPERIGRFDKSLESVLKNAAARKPGVWFATLKEIAEWWRARREFGMEVTKKDNGYRVKLKAEGEASATVLAQGLRMGTSSRKWFGNYLVVKSRSFDVPGTRIPGICLSPKTDGELFDFLRTEGFIVDESTMREKYSLYVEAGDEFDDVEKLKLLKRIDSCSDRPLLRLWRWPNEARSALAITGDIDAVSIYDYARRVVQ